MAHRKIERIEVRLPDVKPVWKEIAFCELVKGDLFRITDFDDGGNVDGENGSKIFVAVSNPYTKDELMIIDTEDYKGTEEEALTFNP